LIEAAPPESALMRHPLLGGDQRPRRQAVGAHASGLARPDEAATLQHVEMLRERRQRHPERARELGDGRGAAAQPVQHGAPRRVGERMEHTVETAGTLRGLLRHMPYRTPLLYLGQCLSFPTVSPPGAGANARRVALLTPSAP